jgi:hypothetical protein
MRRAETLEHFQGLTEEQSRNLDQETLIKVRLEIGDVPIYLTRLADRLGPSPLDAALEKLEIKRHNDPPDRLKACAKRTPGSMIRKYRRLAVARPGETAETTKIFPAAENGTFPALELREGGDTLEILGVFQRAV